ncbi:MAG: tetratricopeptide repeat protein [Vicinamibacterales bacterium]
MQRDQPSQPLEGHLVVFTGKLSSLGRKEARALVVRLGGATADDVSVRTTMVVVGGEGFAGGAATSNKLRRVDELRAQHAAQIAVLSEDDFCRLAGQPAPSDLKQQFHAMRDLLARYPSLREDQLRYLVKYGVVKPVARTNADTYFAFQDLTVIRQAHEEVSQGVPFRAAVRALVASRDGQLALDFRLDAAPAKILTLQQRRAPSLPREPRQPQRNPSLAEEYFHSASALDDGDEATSARAAGLYRRALECDPGMVAALINLANIHYAHDELAEAQALYERAIALDPDFFEAHFNLGNIHHDLAEYEEARACYAAALAQNPQYADAHFYLAVTLEKLGLSQDARPHWKAYQQLAPNGEWVELAREFSEN